MSHRILNTPLGAIHDIVVGFLNTASVNVSSAVNLHINPCFQGVFHTTVPSLHFCE